jgi:undecaprenyl-diphosphatase
MASIDTELFLWLNQWVGHFPIVDDIVRVLVSDYLVPIISSLTLLGLWFWGKDHQQRSRHQKATLTAIIGLALSNLTVLLLNQHYFRIRPFNVHEVSLLFYPPVDSSFPANPIAVAFAMATGVWLGHKKAGFILYIMAVLFGISRVYAGVCYPIDSVAGALVGIASGTIASFILRLVPIHILFQKLGRYFYLA